MEEKIVAMMGLINKIVSNMDTMTTIVNQLVDDVEKLKHDRGLL